MIRSKFGQKVIGNLRKTNLLFWTGVQGILDANHFGACDLRRIYIRNINRLKAHHTSKGASSFSDPEDNVSYTRSVI